MADRERNDLRLQIEVTRRVLEAHERRRALLQRGERPYGIRAVAAHLGSRMKREGARPLRAVAASAVVLLGMAGSVAPSSISDEEPRTPAISALPGSGPGATAEVTVTLNMAGAGRDGVSDADAEPKPDGASGTEPSGGEGSDSGTARSRDQDPRSTAEAPSAAAPAGETESATGGPTPELSGTGGTGDDPASEPELSDTGETDDGPTEEPEPSESPEPSSPDEDTGDAGDATCLGLNALGLTVDLCVTSLLGG